MSADESRSIAPDDCTSLSLLSKVRDLHDQEAWRRFFARYQPIIVNWCLRHDLQRADAEEIAAVVLEKLARLMPTFEYDPAKSFRAWLSTVVKRSIIDFRRRAALPGARGSGDTAQVERLNNLAESDASGLRIEELTQALGDEVERELSRSRAACDQIKGRVQPHVWQAFWWTAVEGRAGNEVAELLGIKVASVFVYKNRVIKMLRQEVAGQEKS
ncbi:MAG: sigma-70 family RNA polymerase sigma factor [Planctomycetota bacterium]|nr:sigma-70 family RNA polymerase sigma factor [Planctomycetota bacterium]